MAVFAVSIVKRTEYFGELREFGNTYHYKTEAIEAFPDRLVIEAIKEQERFVTDDEVQFVRGVSWGPTDGSRLENVMRESVEFSDVGQVASVTPMYKEACSLVVWPLDRSVPLNRRRWLRKFLRMAPGAPIASPSPVSGAAPLPGNSIAALEQYATAIRSLQVLAGSFQLCTDVGDEPNGPGIVRPYLYTRQIGR